MRLEVGPQVAGEGELLVADVAAEGLVACKKITAFISLIYFSPGIYALPTYSRRMGPDSFVEKLNWHKSCAFAPLGSLTAICWRKIQKAPLLKSPRVFSLKKRECNPARTKGTVV